MFIELLDYLRCPRAHEESWLVLAARASDGRDVMEGTLGCPVCRSEFSIVRGVARFVEPGRAISSIEADEDDALRLAATLDLTGQRGYAILIGAWTDQGPLLRTMTDVQLLLVNPGDAIAMGDGLSGLTIDRHWVSLPLGTASARAIALDDTASPAQAAAALTVVSAGGRILAPASLPLPHGATELARDDRHWVAERARMSTSSGIVSLTRRS